MQRNHSPSSHGCVRLTNWDGIDVARRTADGTPVDFVDTRHRQEISMQRLAMFLVALLSYACAGARSAPVVAPTTRELQMIDTLRELDERSDTLLAAAKFQTARKELSDLADAASHEHSDRSDKIKQWRTTAFPTAAKDVALPDCGEGGFAIDAGATDRQIVERLIAHRECALAFAREALANVRSVSVRRLIEKIISAYTTELQELRLLGSAWP